MVQKLVSYCSTVRNILNTCYIRYMIENNSADESDFFEKYSWLQQINTAVYAAKQLRFVSLLTCAHIHEMMAKLLRRCALRQQLCHNHKPLIAAVGLVVLPAAGGEGQEGIPLGEGHTVNIQPVFLLHGLEELGELAPHGSGVNIVEANVLRLHHRVVHLRTGNIQPRHGVGVFAFGVGTLLLPVDGGDGGSSTSEVPEGSSMGSGSF